MPFVNREQVLSVYASVNASLGIETEPLFVENLEGLVSLITDAFSGQSKAGAAEATSGKIKEYEGVVVRTGGDELPDEERKGSEDEEGTQIVNTDDPVLEEEEVPPHEKKEKDKGKELKGGIKKSQGGKKEDGEEGDGEESDGLGAGGSGDEEEGGDEGEEGEVHDGGDEDEEDEEQREDNNSEEEEQQQRMPQPPPPTPEQQEVEDMNDEAIYAYEFKFQPMTKMFFGTPLAYDTWGGENELFKEIEGVLKTGLRIAMYDNVVKNYSEYPERELVIRKNRALDILARIDLLTNTEFLMASDSNGRANANRRNVSRANMEAYIISDKLAERLLPLFFMFRKPIFGHEKVMEYAKFCLTFLGRDKRFLRVEDWSDSELNTTTFDFCDVNTIALGQEVATIFKNRFDDETNKTTFVEEELYRIENGDVVSSTTERRAIMDLQIFIRTLVRFYFTNDKIKMLEAINNYEIRSFRAEYIIATYMLIDLQDLSFPNK